MSTEDQGIVYGNVGILDIRNADPDALRGISRIGNVGLVLHSEENAALVNLLSIGNLGNTVEMPPRGKLEMGSVRLDANALSNRTEPINMIVMGSVTVAADVPPPTSRKAWNGSSSWERSCARTTWWPPCVPGLRVRWEWLTATPPARS